MYADPLPDGGDSGRHKPKPGQPPSSPYLPGKAPFKLVKNKKKGHDVDGNDISWT